MSKTIKLKNVRLSFENVFSKEVYEGKETENYSATLLIPKTNTEAVTTIQSAIDRAMEKAKIKKLPSTAKMCFKDGDETDRPEQEGHWTLKAKTKKRPTVIHNKANGSENLVREDGVIYSGCYVNALIDDNFYCYTNYGKGVSASLLGIQYAGEGESFEGSRVADVNEFDEFDDDEDDGDL